MSVPCRYDVIVGMDLLPLLGVDILTSSMEVKALDTVLPMQPRDEWELHCLDSYLNDDPALTETYASDSPNKILGSYTVFMQSFKTNI
jgi:hypothetical protein